MAALSALVFSLSWWLGLYLLARNPRKPVLAFSAVGLCSFAMAVALDAVRLVTHSALLGHVEIYLVAVPGVAWFAVLLEIARPLTTATGHAPARSLLVSVAAALTLARRHARRPRRGAAAARPCGDVRGDLAVHARAR